jgi:uncharacterized membrane protein
MADENDETKLEKIDRKIRILIVLAVCQTAITSLLFIYLVLENFIPTNSTLLLLFLGLGIFLYLFRGRIPRWFGNSSRFIFANLFELRKSDSIKK